MARMAMVDLPDPGRSASIIAAFLMYSQGLTYEQALGRIRETRPIAELVTSVFSGRLLINEPRPNVNFASQLELFQRAACHVSRQDKAIRMFYLERMVRNIRSTFLHPFGVKFRSRNKDSILQVEKSLT